MEKSKGEFDRTVDRERQVRHAYLRCVDGVLMNAESRRERWLSCDLSMLQRSVVIALSDGIRIIQALSDEDFITAMPADPVCVRPAKYLFK